MSPIPSSVVVLAGDGASVDGQPADLTLAATDDTTGVRGQLALEDVGWCTRISLELVGVAADEECSLVANSGDRATSASHWRILAGGDGSVTMPGAVGLALADIESFTVLDRDGVTLETIPHERVRP